MKLLKCKGLQTVPIRNYAMDRGLLDWQDLHDYYLFRPASLKIIYGDYKPQVVLLFYCLCFLLLMEYSLKV